MGEGVDCKGARENFWGGCDGGFRTIYLLKLSDFTNLKSVKFAVYKYLNKIGLKNKGVQ